MLIKFTENKFGYEYIIIWLLIKIDIYLVIFEFRHMSLLVYDIRLIMFNNETYSQPGLSFVINVPQEPRKLR